MKKLIAEQNIKRDKLSRGLIIALALVVSLFLVGQVVIANRLVEESSRLRTLDKKIAAQEAINNALSAEIRTSGAISVVNQEAQTLGFLPVKKYAYLSGESPVAFTNQIFGFRR